MSSEGQPPPPPPPRLFKPVTTPIGASKEPIAFAFSHLYPALVLGHYYLRFPALVVDPIATLSRDLLPLALAQVAYCVICLPPTGTVKREKDGKGREKEQSETGRNKARERERAKARDGSGGAALTGRISTALLSLLLTILPSTPVLFVLLVLFGAPLTTHHIQTLLCAAHMALLAGTPLFYTNGVDATVWREVLSFYLPGDEVWGGTVGALVGAWLGAVPIPLDWDREWQKWPITIVTGAYLGWSVGRLAGEFLLRGRRIAMDP